MTVWRKQTYIYDDDKLCACTTDIVIDDVVDVINFDIVRVPGVVRDRVRWLAIAVALLVMPV
jgi:hypothetical protein